MTYAVRFTRPALPGLRDYYLWFLEHRPGDSTEVATRFLFEALNPLKGNPYLRQVDELPFPTNEEYRHVRAWNFNVYYVVREDDRVVDIVAVIHQAADPSRLARAVSR